jgi:hypothetical protein
MYQLISRGEIPVIRLGVGNGGRDGRGLIRIPVAAIERLVAAAMKEAEERRSA